MENPFLASADVSVWPGRRLLPARLSRLAPAHQIFVQQVLQILDAIDDEGEAVARDPARVAALVDDAQAGRLDALEQPLDVLVADAAEWPPGMKASYADQFLRDLVTVGLREALAYLFAVEPAFADCRSLVLFLARGYVFAATDFLAHAAAFAGETDAEPERRGAFTVPRDARIWLAGRV